MIKHEADDGKGVFYVDQDEKRPARMTYVMSGESLMIIDHTEVSAIFKGQGVGRQLVMAGVQFARERKFKIVPLCPFASAEFSKHPEYADVLSQ
ncbi:MAG: GNAT family N-acetyltransferase [Candidatus Zixiibacteriota bacterium]